MTVEFETRAGVGVVHDATAENLSEPDPLVETRDEAAEPGPQQAEELLRRIIDFARLDHENPEDIWAGAVAIASRRARHQGRVFEPLIDMPAPLSLFCWYPFNPRPGPMAHERIQSLRSSLFSGIRFDSSPIRRFDGAIRPSFYALSSAQLLTAIESDPLSVLDLGGT